MVLGQPDGTPLQVSMASREKSSRPGNRITSRYSYVFDTKAIIEMGVEAHGAKRRPCWCSCGEVGEPGLDRGPRAGKLGSGPGGSGVLGQEDGGPHTVGVASGWVCLGTVARCGAAFHKLPSRFDATDFKENLETYTCTE